MTNEVRRDTFIIEQLFFELLHVSLGIRICLSHTPSADEWDKLYSIAKKQTLIGVCFAGVQKLVAQQQKPPEILYFTWMGMTAAIQQRNEIVNRQCVELQASLSADGICSCILKGQGVGMQYAEHLRGLRQSGDIDIWIEGGVEAAVKLAERLGQKAEVTEQHVHLDYFPETEVEAHFIPSMLRNPFANRRLQRWFEEQKPIQFEHWNEVRLCVPTTSFNLVYLLIHIYRHLFGEGVGLRQVMDYYFVLQAGDLEGTNSKEKAFQTIKRLGLGNFAGALMFVMREIFGLKRERMLCNPNERHGKFLLNEIIIAGNMGHHDERLKDLHGRTRLLRFYKITKHNMRLIGYYPIETLWAPFTRVKIWAWRKWNGWI